MRGVFSSAPALRPSSPTPFRALNPNDPKAPKDDAISGTDTNLEKDLDGL
jgi:hypothetical protein